MFTGNPFHSLNVFPCLSGGVWSKNCYLRPEEELSFKLDDLGKWFNFVLCLGGGQRRSLA